MPSGSHVCAFGMESTSRLTRFPFDSSNTSPSLLARFPSLLLLVADSIGRRCAFPHPSRRRRSLAGALFGLAARICFRMDSRHQYALGPHSPAIFFPWKQRTSALRRGKDMVYSGKVILKVTRGSPCALGCRARAVCRLSPEVTPAAAEQEDRVEER